MRGEKSGVTMKMIEFQGTLGTLRGALHLPDPAPSCPAVLVCHGFTGHRNESHRIFVKMSRRLETRNIASLRFDFGGSGESDGDFRHVTLPQELADAQRALTVLENLDEAAADRIGLLGMSIGGTIAAALAGCRSSISSVALWGAAAHVRRLFEESMTGDLWSQLDHQGVLDYNANLLGKPLFDTLEQIDPLAGLRESDAPCLLVHGGNDQTVPCADAEAYYFAAMREGRRVEKTILEQAGHSFASARDESRVIELTTEWFHKTLTSV